uniref:AP-5 complex subunit zeta-1 n=1 Tax=Tanacetum cinerariifolium TaxID=118510 RepID=A0A6L2LQ62_TANCI|nr:AP-5 complex subunit zeta-1 [Tanacetum cinerariifolium]
MDELNFKGKQLKISIKNSKRLDSYNVEYRTSPRLVKREIAEKLYQALRSSYSSISQEVDKCKKDEIRINNEIMCFSTGDKRGEWKKQNIKNLEEALGGVKHQIRISSIPRAELNHVMESLVHRIQHRNNNRAEEAKLHHEIRNLNDTIEIYTTPTVTPPTPLDFTWNGSGITGGKSSPSDRLKQALNPIVDRLGEAYDSPEKTELALQLCWAIGVYGEGSASHKDAAHELFESIELLLYENLSSRCAIKKADFGNAVCDEVLKGLKIKDLGCGGHKGVHTELECF